MTHDEQEKIIERVRKLLALAAEGSGASEHEAATAAAKAQELLLRHNLNAAHLEEVRDAVDNKIIDDHDSYSMGWRSSLIFAIANSTGCRAVQWTDYRHSFGKKFHIFGEPANIEVATYLYSYLTRELMRLSPKPAASAKGHAFRMGAVHTVALRLRQTFSEFQNASDETRALVVTMSEAVNKALAEKYPKLNKGRGGSISDNEAYRAGREAGKSIELRRGVSGARNAGGQILLG